MADISTTLSILSSKVKLGVKRYGPQAMIIGGGIGTIAAIVLAVVETKKAIEIVDESKKELANIREKEIEDDYTEKDKKKELTKAYARTAGKLALNYAPAVGVEIASLGLIAGGSKIINNQKATLATALAANISDFKNYRKRLIAKLGEEGEKVDKELLYGLTEVDSEETTTENGKTKKVKKKAYLVDDGNLSSTGYKRLLDARNPLWDSHPDTVMYLLNAKQRWFNDRLNAFGYVFLNDVLDELGFEKTRVGQEVGWLKNGDGDCYIDFDVVPVRVFHSDVGDEDIKKLDEPCRNCAYMLNFNVDGGILTKVDFPDQFGG